MNISPGDRTEEEGNTLCINKISLLGAFLGCC
jgi:hypothetical protein